MHKVHINPNDLTLYLDDDKSLLEQLKANDLYVKSSCGGHASCTDCVIKVIDGKENVNDPTFAETQLLGNVFHITKERLACQCFVKGEIKIDLSAHDKAQDENRRQNKSKKMSSGTKVRKKQEVESIISERKEKSRLKRESKEDESWKNHWEKGKSGSQKRLGGGKRPTKIKDIEDLD